MQTLPAFLPPTAALLREPVSIGLLQTLQRDPVAVPFLPQPAETAWTFAAGSDDPPILLLHGFDSSALEFRFVLPRLGQRHPTWAVDLWGFGFTGRQSGAAYGRAEIQTHLHAFWQAHIQRPVLVVGASMGGAAAVDFAVNHPQAVQKLVLIASTGFTGPPAWLGGLAEPLREAAVEYFRQRRLVALGWSELVGDRNTAELIRCAALPMEMPHWREAMLDFNARGGYRILEEQIRAVTQPTLILWGEKDDSIPPADALKFLAAIDNSALIWIGGCGHVPQIERPGVTAGYILRFALA
ncbi:alpha/beta fold hydrolase [Gloeobacter morelensis]|uniref:Alpha/beta hydrolase n=1 Tax=Gloeobacter morelensis MG652769 TaxID=2781736 RepID=A0ABY3PK57_9CYAN|nr:alpha/beta hydrolase [Gloeobacter morelensis]UFP94018.1 alpha/beta hydrolase [Gloeobacter morelensis MG652769]